MPGRANHPKEAVVDIPSHVILETITKTVVKTEDGLHFMKYEGKTTSGGTWQAVRTGTITVSEGAHQ
jgi:hypothetical protein